MRSFGRLTVLKAVSLRMSWNSKECLIIILCYSIYGTNVCWGKGYFPSFIEVFATHSSPMCCKTQYVMEALCEYGHTIVNGLHSRPSLLLDSCITCLLFQRRRIFAISIH